MKKSIKTVGLLLEAITFSVLCADPEPAVFPCMGADAGKSCFINCSPVKKPALLWQCKFVDERGIRGNHSILQPVVGPAGKEVYLCTKEAVIRINAETGKIDREWKGLYTGEATLADNSVLIAGSKSLTMLDSATGNAVWEAKCDNLIHGGHWAWSPLEVTVLDGMAYFGKGVNYENTEKDDAIYSIKIADGERKWRKPMGNNCVVVSAVAVEGDFAVSLVAVPLPVNEQNPAGPKKRLIFRALNSKDGSLKWEYVLDSTKGGDRNGPAIKDGVVYGADARFAFALKLSTGEIIWKKDRVLKNINPKKCFGNAVVISGDLVITGLSAIEARDRNDGSLRWEANLPLINFMAAAGDVLYVGCYQSDIHAYSMKDGSKHWTFTAPEVPEAVNPRRNCRGLAVADGRVYFTTYQGVLYCLGEAPIADLKPQPE